MWLVIICMKTLKTELKKLSLKVSYYKQWHSLSATPIQLYICSTVLLNTVRKMVVVLKQCTM